LNLIWVLLVFFVSFSSKVCSGTGAAVASGCAAPSLFSSLGVGAGAGAEEFAFTATFLISMYSSINSAVSNDGIQF
jgi:hypothetical protein